MYDCTLDKTYSDYNLRLSTSHDFTKLLHYVVSQPCKDIEFVPKLVVPVTYG